MKRENPSGKNLRLVAVFLACVLFLLGVSLFVKIASVVSKSSFDGQHKFNVLISGDNKSDIVSFAPDTHTITILQIPGNSSLEQVRKVLEIPIDGYISKNSFDLDKIENNVSVEAALRKTALNYKSKNTNLTIIDIGRLWFFARTIKSHELSFKRISFSLSEISSKGDSFIDKISIQFFADSSIVLEKSNIQIVNGTDVAGLANRLARLVTNMGGNVIAVNTSEKEIRKSYISYYGQENYTLKRLNKVLGFNINKEQKENISDITIVIGKDSLSKLVY